MSDRTIFNHLFETAKQSKDKKGVVVAGYVRDNDIICAFPSSDDGLYHAEDLLIKYLRKNRIQPLSRDILYVTLVPCSRRSNGKNVRDCTSVIIDAGIKNIVYAATDPRQSGETLLRLKNAKVNIKRTLYTDIVEIAKELFNRTQSDPDMTI